MMIDFKSVKAIKTPVADNKDIVKAYLGSRLLWEYEPEIVVFDRVEVGFVSINFYVNNKRISGPFKYLEVDGERFDLSDSYPGIYNEPTYGRFMVSTLTSKKAVDFLYERGFYKMGSRDVTNVRVIGG